MPTERDPSLARLSIVGIICISLFATLTFRLWYLQVIDQTKRITDAQVDVKTVSEQGIRGRILDRNGKVLVQNRLIRLVQMNRAPLRDLTDRQRTKVFNDLARTLTSFGTPTKGPALQKLYDDQRYGPLEPVPLLTLDDPAAVNDLVVYLEERHERFPGIEVVNKTVREYPYGAVAAHILGYVLRINQAELDTKSKQQEEALAKGSNEPVKKYSPNDEIGKSGVEKTFEDYLRGTPSEKQIKVDPSGDYVSTVKESDPEPGDDLWLSIDVDVQAMAERVLAAQLNGRTTTFKGKVSQQQGSIVVIDPTNGQVLALASYPTFDPTALVNGIDDATWKYFQDPSHGYPLYNWALQGNYSPGSTFKITTATAGLDSGFLVPGNDSYPDRGVYKVQNCKGDKCTFQNAKREAFGTVNVTRALTVSSDVFFYWIADSFWQRRSQFGETPIQDAASSYGFGSKSGIQLPFESAGRVPTPASRRAAHEKNPSAFPNGSWYSGDNINTSVGQGDVAATPLQLANAYATFANGGTRWVPQIVSKITHPKDLGLNPADPENYDLVTEAAAQKAGTVSFVDGAYEQLFQGLFGAVNNPSGTAYDAFSGRKLGFPVAGKTGTVQVNGREDTSVFAAFGPADAAIPANPANPSKYAISVVMPESGFGGKVAAPMAATMLQAISTGTVEPAGRLEASARPPSLAIGTG